MESALPKIAVVFAVVALLGASAAVATPPGRLHPALRALQKTLRRNSAGTPSASVEALRVSAKRKVLAFVLAVLAAAVAAVCNSL